MNQLENETDAKDDRMQNTRNEIDEAYTKWNKNQERYGMVFGGALRSPYLTSTELCTPQILLERLFWHF